MKWIELAALPTVVVGIPLGSNGIHESMLRSFHVLQKVLGYLKQGVPGPIILEMVEELEQLAILYQRVEQAALMQVDQRKLGAPVS